MLVEWIGIFRQIVFLLFATCVGMVHADVGVYDPLAITDVQNTQPVDLIVHDARRNRDIPLRIYLPFERSAAPLILYSHGLGGSRESNPYLGKHWSSRGYVVVFLQHAGSDDAVWKDIAPARRMTALKQAANVANAIQRFKDVPAVIDQLAVWNRSGDSPLKDRIDLQRIGMSGHSFGAVTTQAVSGQRTADGKDRFTDKRIVAAVAMSPNSPRDGGDPQQLFGGVSIPWLLMTGTRDKAIVGDADVESRLAVFPALPPGGKYELVLDGAEHEAFGDRELPASSAKRNPNHHRSILAVSTAFWDAWLGRRDDARTWLDGKGALSVLDSKDVWLVK